MYDNDTISAISTPLGEAGIGIVRLSGGDAIRIADMLFSSTTGRSIKSAKSHTIFYGYIKDPETSKPVDEVLVTVMKAPKTYTKEDVVEINCHGGFVPLRRVLELTIKHGARLAEPGEFTKRAFLNGRIDLTQAEAVIDLIRAKTDMAERIALKQLRGNLRQRLSALKDGLINIVAHIEAHIDFPEEDIEPSSMNEIIEKLKEIMDELTSISRTYEEGRFFRDGLKVAIVGRPNVGKSSLLNTLLQKDRAIVTPQPGTTRDVIEDFINIKGLPIIVMDTAGIRASHEMAEKEGVRRSLEAINSADLVIAVIDGSEALKEEDLLVIEKVKDKRSLIVINKSDLPPADIKLSGRRVSALMSSGIDELKEAIFESVIGVREIPSPLEKPPVEEFKEENALPLITNLRHKLAMDRALKRLDAGAILIKENSALELIAMELREAMERLGEITGSVSTEEVLERVFSSFCIGK